MNFVDAYLNEMTPANAHETITEIAEIWNTVTHGLSVDSFAGRPQYIKDLVCILNFDAIWAWDGLADFVACGDKELYMCTISAFEHIGFTPAVKILREILEVDEVRDFYNNRSFFIKYQVLLEINAFERKLQAANYSTSMWALLERYVLKMYSQALPGAAG